MKEGKKAIPSAETILKENEAVSQDGGNGPKGTSTKAPSYYSHSCKAAHAVVLWRRRSINQSCGWQAAKPSN